MRKYILAITVLALSLSGCKLFERDHDSRFRPTSGYEAGR